MEECAWTQFDGNLVRTFIDMMDEMKIPDYMLPSDSKNEV